MARGCVPLGMAPRQGARDGEDYAYHVASFLCEGQVAFQTDCQGTADCVQRGAQWASRAGSPRTRLWSAANAAFETDLGHAVTKVLSRAAKADISAGKATYWQRHGNKRADRFAMAGATLALPT